MAQDNVTLGRFQLIGIPPAQRGVPQIEVTFDLDANGILSVTAKDLGTNKEQKITITAPHKMSKDDIEKKVKEAESFAEKDKQVKAEIEIRNEADSLAYTAEKTVKELKEKMSKEDVEKVEAQVKTVREAIAKNNLEEIKAKTEELRTTIQAIGAKIYQDAAKQQGAGANQTGQQDGQGPNQGPQGDNSDKKGNGNYYDADFKETK
jgi:molecular chaperone DnaK